jgi:probable HAF family extracellular repeat protein
LDDDGQVVGWSESADDSFRATRWTTPIADPTEIPMPTSVIHSQARAASGKGGKIVGTWLDGEGSSHGFFWDGVSPTATEIGFLYDGRSTTPRAVNNSGQVVGSCDTQPAVAGVRDRACLWQGGVLTDLGALGDGRYSVALDINELGQAVGESLTESGTLRAVLWTPLLSPEQRIEGLIRQVEALVDDGELANGPGNALLASLEVALKQLEHGNQGTVCNVLQAFVNKVEAFVTGGTLSEADGAALLVAVNAITAELCG